MCGITGIISKQPIQNDIIEVFTSIAIKNINQSISKVGFFSIQADEVKCHKYELLAICVRYVENLTINEVFLKFVNVSSCRNTEFLYNSIKTTLSDIGIYNIPIVCQSYDGASVMNGVHGGVQRLIKNDHESAIYIHCMAHRLNLALVESTKACTASADFFLLLESYNLFSNPIHHSRYIDICQTLNLHVLEIVALSETRWACRYKTVRTILENKQALIKVLEEIAVSANQSKFEAKGLLNQINSSNFLFCLIMFY